MLFSIFPFSPKTFCGSNSISTRFAALCLCLALALGASGARVFAQSAAPDSLNDAPADPQLVTSAPLAGAAIRNRAFVTYEVENQPVRVDSNEVAVAVSGVASLSLVPDIERRVTAGASVSLAHRLLNTGNVATAYTLLLASLSGDSYDLSDLRVVRDANGNGTFDSGEAVVAPNQKIFLSPGESADFVVLGTVPTSVSPDAVSRTRLSAIVAGPAPGASEGDFSPVSDSVLDSLTIVPGAVITVRKSVSTTQSAPGQEVTFTIVASNSGTISPAPRNLRVDGALRAFVLIRDGIPANTTFVALDTPQNGATRLYHRAGDADDAYTSLPPVNLGSVDNVALGLAGIAPNASALMTLRVRLNLNASGAILNTAEVLFVDPLVGDVSAVVSNQVQVTLPVQPPKLDYYTGNSYVLIAGVTNVGRPLWLQGRAAAANRDASRVETIQITVRSKLTGDFVIYTGIETGPNTGIFRVEKPIPTSGGEADTSNATLEIRPNDQLDASFDDGGGARAIANILVDPFGVVFDSRTNEPIAGARVTLIDVTGQGNGGKAGAPARVLDVDGVTPISATVTTGADGKFQYALVAGSTYRLDVVAPTGFSFPSKVSIFLLPPGRRIDASASFGGNFRVDAATGAVQLDVPLDPPPPAGLFLQKTASRRTAEIADFVDYEIRLRNTTGTRLTAISIADALPRGFSLVGGTSRRDGIAIADPNGAPGPALSFLIGDLAPDAEVRLSYRVRIGAGVSSGEQVNRAQASGQTLTGPVTSNTAAAPVRIRGGVLTERAIIFGKVFVDSNRNHVEDGGEPGIPGVRVWMEDGTFAITDSDGKYSIYGLSARTHVVKVDRTTLPANVIWEALTVRHGGRGDSAFADLKKAELHRVNFALIEASPALLAEIERRRVAGDPFAAEIAPVLQGDLRSRTDDVTPDRRSLPSTGTMGASGPIAATGGAGFDTLNPAAKSALNTSPNGNNAGTFDAAGNVFVPGAPLNAQNSNLASTDAATGPEGQLATSTGRLETSIDELATSEGKLGDSKVPSFNSKGQLANSMGQLVAKEGELGVSGGSNAAIENSAQFEAYLKGQNNDFAVLSPRDGEVLALDQAAVRLKGLSGANFVLRVNGVEVPQSRVGARLSDSARNLQAWEWVGVPFKAGQNLIEAAQTDGFGNERGHVTLRVIAPGAAARLVWDAPKSGQSADGATPVSLSLRVVDDKSFPVMTRTPVTLETASGRFDLEDGDEREPGTQVFIEGGVLKLQLSPPSEPGDGLVRAQSGNLDARAKLSFVPALRPLIALGTLEGGVNFFNFNPKGVSGDLFEDQTKGLLSAQNGKTALSSRAALFLKGRVLGKNLLTLRYDSQSTRERLFRDIQPDEYYPVYGDGALRGFDAQSTGRLYVRLDRARNSFLYGDFTTASDTQFNTLSNYQRALNGARQHLENDKYRVDAFAARDSGTQIVDEIRANGTSGGYSLRSGGLLENSERVEIIVRDRNNLGVILEVRPQTRLRDYEFDFETGRILFRSPVPTYDANFNPIFVRVFSQVENGGPKFWVQGLNGAVKITPNLEIGGSLVRDSDPLDNFGMQSVNATLKVGENTTVSGELAHTNRDSLGSGSGSRLEILHESANVKARFFVGRTSSQFDNPGSILSRGRGETSLRASWKLDAKTRFLAEALRTSDTSSGNNRTGLQAAIEREFGRGIRAEIGVRHAKEDAPVSGNSVGATPIEFTSLRARLTVPAGERASVFGEVESDISDTSRRVLAAGGDYRLNSRSRIYARHEFISSLDGRYALNDNQEQQNTLFGLDTAYGGFGHLFSEYRLQGALSGREAQAALGLRDAWNIADGVKVSGGFERTKSMNSGAGTGAETGNDSTALTGGIEYTRSENVKASSRLELRRAATSDTILGTLGAAARLSSRLTLLSRGIFNLQRGRDGSSDAAQHRFQLGLSYRDREHDKWSGLAKYEFRQTKNGTTAGAFLPGDSAVSGAVGGTVHLFSLDANFQKSAKLTLSGHLAAKFNSDKSNGIASSAWAQLASARAIYDLNSKTELSAQAAVLTSKGGGIQTGWGAELGRLVGRDLWLSAGYNFGAVGDGDLNGGGTTRRGPYLRIRFKFDESLLGSHEAQLLAASDAKNDPKTENGAGNRTVEVPVVAVDPQTQEKTELPLTAQVEVAQNAPDPQAVEIDAPPATDGTVAAPETIPETVIESAAPLHPRVVDASGAQWQFEIMPFGDARAMRDYLAAQSQSRRAESKGDFAALSGRKASAAPVFVTASAKVRPAFSKLKITPTSKPHFLRKKSAPRRALRAAATQTLVFHRKKAPPRRTHVPNRAWWLK